MDESLRCCECGCGQLTQVRFINHHNLGKGNKHISWKGGKTAFFISGHFYLHDNASRCFEHRLIAERIIGRKLESEHPIHHPWGKTLDNSCFIICEDNDYHMFLHVRERAFKNCGNAKWRKCQFCKKYDSPENLIFTTRKIYHKPCRMKYEKTTSSYQKRIKYA